MSEDPKVMSAEQLEKEIAEAEAFAAQDSEEQTMPLFPEQDIKIDDDSKNNLVVDILTGVRQIQEANDGGRELHFR